jgi:hypothetical protein
MEVKRKTDNEEIKTNHAKLLATMEADREEWRVGQERLLDVMNAWQKDDSLPTDGGRPRGEADLTGQET